MAILTYLGHNSFRLSSNDNRMVVYIDPYAGDDYTIPADLILVSHEHFDHNQTDLVQLKPFGKIMRAENFIQEGKYQTFNFHGLKVEGVPAENINHSIKECVGFVIEVDGVKLYFACDTSKTDYMHELAKRHLDYAFLPCDGKYNMDVKEASECAEIIKAKRTMPVHTNPDKLYDKKIAKEFIDICDNELIVLIIGIDESIELRKMA